MDVVVVAQNDNTVFVQRGQRAPSHALNVAMQNITVIEVQQSQSHDGDVVVLGVLGFLLRSCGSQRTVPLLA